MRNKNKPWIIIMTAGFRLSFDLHQGTHLRWTRDRSGVNWIEFVNYQRRANVVFSEAGRQISVRSRDVLMNAQSLLKCGPPLIVGCVWLEFGFVSSSSYWWGGGGLVCDSVGNTELLAAHFEGKQSRDPVDLPFTYHPSPSLTIFAFSSWEVRRLLVDLTNCVCFLFF